MTMPQPRRGRSDAPLTEASPARKHTGSRRRPAAEARTIPSLPTRPFPISHILASDSGCGTYVILEIF